MVLGLADEPDAQRQRAVTLDPGAPGVAVLGRAGAGRTTVLRTIAAQVPHDRVCWLPDDLEAAWDVIVGLDDIPPGWLIVVDDLDRVLARLPDDYSAAAAAILERVARDSRSRGVQFICSAQRMTGAVGRIVDQLPDRAVLAAVSRSEHVAFGGEGLTMTRRPQRAAGGGAAYSCSSRTPERSTPRGSGPGRPTCSSRATPRRSSRRPPPPRVPRWSIGIVGASRSRPSSRRRRCGRGGWSGAPRTPGSVGGAQRRPPRRPDASSSSMPRAWGGAASDRQQRSAAVRRSRARPRLGHRHADGSGPAGGAAPQLSASSNDPAVMPCAAATPELTTWPPAVFNPAARAPSARRATRQPWRAICRT